MRKRTLGIFSVTLISLIISACSSGISQEEYDSVVAERDKLQADYDSLNEKYTDKLNEEADTLVDDLPLSYANAWASSSFSGETSCSISDKTLFVSVMTQEEISSENVSALWDELLSSVTVYTATAELSPDALDFDNISVAFYDNNMCGIFQVTIDARAHGSKDVMINSQHLDTVYEGLTSELD